MARPGHTRAMATTIVTAGAVAATAVIGGVAADPGSAWYRGLRKPRWQPPPPAYALVWTPLYATITYACARAVTRARSRDRSQLVGSLILDLALNAAWTPLFFRARRPRAALAEIACLNIANALLIRQTWRADRAAAVLLLPYAGWTVFATALNAEIVRLNPSVAAATHAMKPR
jgi:translocator protein